MQEWKAISWGITSLAVANLTAMALVFFLNFSRPTAFRVVSVFKISAEALLLLIPVDFWMRRKQGEEYGPAVFNAALVVLMFCIWFVIAAATF